MKLSVLQAFRLPKAGNSTEEYEDAFDVALLEGRFAIADGATESSFANRWAQSLVQGFTAQPPVLKSAFETDLQPWLEPLQRELQNGIDWDNLPWFAIEKAQDGAFSTLLGLEFFESDLPEQIRWRALAVGDSCLFQVQNEGGLVAFPLEKGDQFGSRPLLVSSNPQKNQRVWEAIALREGMAHPGDVFFLMTDALAHWFLTQCESGETPWKTLQEIKTQEEFDAWVTLLRQSHVMRNDDMTLVTVRVEINDSLADVSNEALPPTAQKQTGESISKSPTWRTIGKLVMEKLFPKKMH